MNRARILIADDHEFVRAGLAKILTAAHPEWEIAGEAVNGQEAIEMGQRLRPDVLIVDLSMPVANGIEVTEKLVKSVPGIRVAVLTIHSAEPVMRQVRQVGSVRFPCEERSPGQTCRRSGENAVRREVLFIRIGVTAAFQTSGAPVCARSIPADSQRTRGSEQPGAGSQQ